jgi:Peptidase family M23
MMFQRNVFPKSIASSLVFLATAGALVLGSGTGIASAATSAAPPWNPALGFADEHDCSSGDLREYGVDVSLPANTAVFAPEPGRIVGYQASSSAWQPGRLLEKLDSGPVVGLGHVNAPLVSIGTRVAAGQQITTIGDNGGNSHVEFMFDQSGQGGPGYYQRSYFCPPNPLPKLAFYMAQPPPSAQFTGASDPVAVSGGPNGMDLFMTGADGSLYHKWYNNGVWAGWESLGRPGAAVAGDVSVLVTSPGQAAIFARGSDGGLYARNSHTGGWDAWTRIASNVGGDPVAATGSGFASADVYYQDSVTQALDRTWWNGTGWSTAAVPDGRIVGKPAVHESNGLIQVFVRGINNELWSDRFTGTWAGWTDLNGQTASDPVLSTTKSGELDLYVTGLNDSPFWSNTAAGGWNLVSGQLTSAFEVVGNGPNVIDGFGRGLDGALWHYTGTGWESLGGSLQGNPSVAGGGPDPLDVFVRGADNAVYWTHWNNGWSAYQSMGNQITGSN